MLAGRRPKKDKNTTDYILEPLLEFSAPEEKRAFYFFQNVTAPCISGDLDSVFWRVIVLQISQTEPAVRHAVLAVSSLHEGLATGTITPLEDGTIAHATQSFALQQYNKAIARLLDQMNNPLTSPLASLLTCVLFVCIEYMQGKDRESLIHLEQGRQLLACLGQQATNAELDCIVRHVVPLYTRLSLTSFLFGGNPVPIPDSLKVHREVPDTFDTIDNMRHSMHEFMEQAFRFTQRARPAKNPSDHVSQETMRSLEIEQNCLLSRLAKLNVAFSLFRASRSKAGPENALLVLQMYLHAQHIWISTALSSSEIVYDNFLSSFAAIVPLAAAYLDLETAPQQTSASTTQKHHQPAIDPSMKALAPEQLSGAYVSNFTFETHIIPPLYYVATKCRHPLIRRSALELLKQNPSRRENLWRASVMGALAGHIVSLEEQSAQRAGVAQADSLSHIANGSTTGRSYDAPFSQQQSAHCIAHDSRDDFDFYRTSVADEQNHTSISASAVPRTMSNSGFTDVEVTTFASQQPSLTSFITTVDDGYNMASRAEPAMDLVDNSDYDETWLWQRNHNQQRHLQAQGDQHSHFGRSMSATSQYTVHAALHARLYHSEQSSVAADYSSHSGSSDGSSVDVEEHQSYQTLVGGPVYPQPHQQQQYQQYQQALTRTSSAMSQRPPMGSHKPAVNLPTEAPFGLPEELRVHDAIIGPEKEDGTWVAIFRKLHGVDTDWDIQHQWVTAL